MIFGILSTTSMDNIDDDDDDDGGDNKNDLETKLNNFNKEGKWNIILLIFS